VAGKNHYTAAGRDDRLPALRKTAVLPDNRVGGAKFQPAYHIYGSILCGNTPPMEKYFLFESLLAN
jgi:hypothetical protein